MTRAYKNFKHNSNTRKRRSVSPEYLAHKFLRGGGSLKTAYCDEDDDGVVASTFALGRTSAVYKGAACEVAYDPPPKSGPESLSATVLAPAAGPTNLIQPSPLSGPTEVTATYDPVPKLGPESLTGSVQIPADGPSDLTGEVIAPVNGPSSLTGQYMPSKSDIAFKFEENDEWWSFQYSYGSETRTKIEGYYAILNNDPGYYLQDQTTFDPTTSYKGGAVSGPSAYIKVANLDCSDPGTGETCIMYRTPVRFFRTDSPSTDLIWAFSKQFGCPKIECDPDGYNVNANLFPLDSVASLPCELPAAGPSELTATFTPAPLYGPSELTATVEPLSLTAELDSSVDLEMIWVEPGTFTMGSPTTEANRFTDETQHDVTLTKGFYLGKYEVTQAQYEAVMTGNTDGLSATPSEWPTSPNHPVEKVSWDDVQVFLSRLNEQQSANITDGWAYVLPTESQWEYACRAGTTTARPWGDSITTSDANYRENEGSFIPHEETSSVGSYPANPWGFFDMLGNVEEWCSDWRGTYPTGNPVIDPTGPATGSYRIKRGDSWSSSAKNVRSARRDGHAGRSRQVGFRIALQEQ